MVAWIQANWQEVCAVAGALHVFLNILGKYTNNKSIQGLDNTFMSLLAAFGIKPGSTTLPNA